ELTVNRVLENACRALLADPVQVAYDARPFDRSAETGFDASGIGPRGVALEKTLGELFDLSHEYRGHAAEHRRILHGQLVERRCRRPVTYFMLKIPHSHTGFQ